jgi:hypothetical protein
MRSYEWGDVTEVTATCFHLGRTNRDSYELIMRDGAAIDLAVLADRFIEAYPMIAARLRAQPFSFRADGARCPAHLKAIFSRRPGDRVG